MRGKILVLLLFFCLCTQAASSPTPTLIIAADRWCPYNCAPKSEHPGFMIEIAQRIFAQHCIKIEYRIMPWSRAIQGTRQGEFDAVVGASKADARDFVFPLVEQGRMKNSFWVRQDAQWRYQGIESLQYNILGVSSEYSYGPKLDDYIANPNNAFYIQVMYGSSPLKTGLKMLSAKRIDIFIEDESVFRHYMMSQSSPSSFKQAGSLSLEDDFANVFVAFSPAKQDSAHWADILSLGTEQLRASGELQKILSAYGLEDWRQPEDNN
ncbi:transporter substrate-binding domain-containing protein [Aliiglaciecola sp. CAU 1673]|uniref:substrate-binding periplasmic protein n=1 Tax=Aliiglaciecola sp. CAU 1673 TaxID=3032595 RepID=UPI0023DB2DDA|nr:transporter substrate-binding domain-containing protein [Aliiglaciecola sp. CAU 1673]MDF2176643.1 transporter substrate-binding domain-containing protein [Aliiglaciecola sp. CAU 1673]